MSKLIVGLSGLARSGKDTFCALLVEELGKIGLRAKRFALADDLKAELRDFIGANYGIDILKCTPEEKELVREFLVFHGKMKRLASQGGHWTTLTDHKIQVSRDIDVAIVTDIRYDIYPNDECPWIKAHGPLVHIKRYTVEHGFHGELSKRHYIQPPNKDEELNDPRLIAKADYTVDWETGDIETFCRPEVIKFIAWLQEKAYLFV